MNGSTTPTRVVELSHHIVDGDVGYPGLPRPRIRPHTTHEASAGRYADGATFAISHVSMVGNTGTYLDSPAHRFPGRADVAALPIASLIDLPAVVVRVDERAPHPIAFEVTPDMAGAAVLLATGWSGLRGSAAYWQPAPFLASGTADELAGVGAALVGVDVWNVDDTRSTGRPVHTALLGAGVPIVEHLTGLAAVPERGASFSAVPLAVDGAVSMPVRAWARVPADERV